MRLLRHRSTHRPVVTHGLRLLAGLSLLVTPAVLSPPAYAGSTGQTNLLMPQGAGTEAQDGDWFSSDNASTCTGCLTGTPLNTIYRYYIEVPAGQTRLQVQIFDADVGSGFSANEDDAGRDRSRNTGGTNPFTLTAKYTLLNPSGASVATQTCAHPTTSTFCKDNTWTTLYNTTTTPIPAGHWELDVDQSTDVPNSRTTTNDINAFGIRADTGTQGVGTELPIYYQAQNQIGVNPIGNNGAASANSRSYTFYPYITAGCSFNQDDFDFDLGNVGTGANQNVGEIDFTSRTGSFTQNFAFSTLSANDNWNTNTVSGFTSPGDSVDYGIWEMNPTIKTYLTGNNNGTINGNYANIYLGTYAETSPQTTPPANNNPTANTFRVYFPASNTGGAPLKPYMTQQARWVNSGPNPPASGQTTLFQVTVTVVNPTAEPITFSATDLVKTNVPGTHALYGGSPAASQGGASITAPAVGASGNITWDPGTLAAGGTALLTYLVKVTPTATGQLIPVVGTVASGNGTTGTWVDETGDTTAGHRATLTFGPLCEVTATSGTISPAEVVDLHASATTRGALVEWQTAAEIATSGFDLYRLDAGTSSWTKVNHSTVPALAGAAQGATYRVLDEGAPRTGQVFYQVVEHETRGGRRHFPFAATIEAARDATTSPALLAAGYERLPRQDAGREARNAQVAEEAAATAAPLATGAALTTPIAPMVAGATQSLKIEVAQDGLYRITPDQLAMLTGPPASGSKKLNTKLSLSSQGKPVAWLQNLDGSVLFYGQAIHDSIYTTTNVYWLRQGNGVTMATKPVSGGSGSANPTASFPWTQNTRSATFAGVVLPLDPESDYWFWQALAAGDPVNGTASFTVAAPDVNSGGNQTLTVHLMGAVDAANDVQVSLNGAPLGNASWNGIGAFDATFPASGLNPNGSNTVTTTAVLDNGVEESNVYVQSFDVGYERAYNAVGDTLAFTGAGNSQVTVGGFSGTAVRLLDLTNPLQPALVLGANVNALQGGGANLSFMPASATTPYLAVGPQAILAPSRVLLYSDPALNTQPSGADYLILTNSSLAPAAQSLAALRSAQGLLTKVVLVGDVMNDFNNGISTPHALQAFLSYVKTTWKPVPRYVVLAGGGNFDYRNFLGLGGDIVPPLMVSTDSGIYASDNHLVDVDGDGIPDFAVGRLPALSNAELQSFVNKIAAYEATPSGQWTNQAMFFADEPGPDDGETDYAADSATMAAGLPRLWMSQQIDLTSTNITAARTTLFNGLASGAGLVNYLGHAGLDRLSPLSLLTTTDATSLTNGPRLPLLAALTCNVNRFDVPGFTSLGEQMTLQPNGGAAATWSSSGLSYHPEGKELARLFYLDLNILGSQRLGDVTLRALTQYGQEPGLLDTVNLYTLLGDPGLQIKPLTVPATTGGTTNTRE